MTNVDRHRVEYSFLFGNEVPSFGAFVRTATFRLALFYPFCVVFSNSVTDAWDLLLILFWLLGGRWKERLETFKSSPILVASAILTLVSFISVFQYETSFFQSLRYWRGHHPIPMLIVLGTLVTNKTKRVQLLGATASALLLSLFYSVAARHGILADVLGVFKPAHIAKNTIWFGMAFVLLAGLWISFPFSARLNPALRPRLGVFLRRSMRNAASFSPFQQFRALFRFRDGSFVTGLLCLLRWGIISFSLGYVMLFNPSRTAVFAILLGISSQLLLWNRRWGTVAILIFLTFSLTVSFTTSSTFQKKTRAMIGEIERFQDHLNKEKHDLSHNVTGSRLWLYWKATKSMLRHPMGIGMERTQLKCLKYTANHSDNVHNEFLAIGLQSGLQGLACFFVWFFFLFRQSSRLPRPWKFLGIYIAVTLWIDCMFNGALSQDTEGHLYCVLIALIASVDAERNRSSRTRP